ncbi:MAG: M56 family metallopeptidase [Thermoanaerobaculia bacterium]
MPETLLALFVQSAAAAGLTSALLTAWNVRRPGTRLRFWLLALALPVVLPPILSFAAPLRASEGFRRSAALFVASRWAALPLGTWRLGSIVTAAVSVVGIALFLRDIVPALRQGVRLRGHGGGKDPREREVGERVAAYAAHRSAVPPATALVPDDEAAYLYCRGVVRPVVAVSTGALATLSADELDAALAHEVAHVASGHLVLGWSLIAFRSIFFFNPVTQIVGRTAVLEMERAADADAATATGRPAAVASALAKLGVMADDDGLNLPGGLRFAAVKARLLRLAEPGEGAGADGLDALRLSLAGVGIALLVFFVVP